MTRPISASIHNFLFQLTMENMDYQKTLEASLDSQKYLTREVSIKVLLHDDDDNDVG